MSQQNRSFRFILCEPANNQMQYLRGMQTILFIFGISSSPSKILCNISGILPDGLCRNDAAVGVSPFGTLIFAGQQ